MKTSRTYIDMYLYHDVLTQYLSKMISYFCFFVGWLFKVVLTDTKELNNLMTEDQYKTFLKNNEH